MAIATGVAIALTVGAVASTASAVGAGIAKGRSKDKVEELESDMLTLEGNRPDIINPYADVTDLSSMIKNEYANLGVATQAAEFQAKEADIALANTLDTLRATGAGGGGATALAQAALRSKKGIAANIEQQEVGNERLRAQGQAAANQAKMAEAQRMQQADVAGKQFVYGEEKEQWMTEADRLQNQIDQERAQTAQYSQDMWGAIGGFGSDLMGLAGAGALKKG